MQATVGAGLPVIATLKHLVDTGDHILKVEGIFSGTLSYIFNMFSQDKPFSEIVTEAKALGYTEPDPRDDLAGMDVARKVTILARYRLPLPGATKTLFLRCARMAVLVFNLCPTFLDLGVGAASSTVRLVVYASAASQVVADTG